MLKTVKTNVEQETAMFLTVAGPALEAQLVGVRFYEMIYNFKD